MRASNRPNPQSRLANWIRAERASKGNLEMAIIELKDLRLSFPDEWHERTIVAVSAPPNDAWKVTPNFVVTRDLALEGESLEAYTDRQLIELAKRLEEFKLFARK